ncbi:MAG: hypothetical protein HY444_10325 [Nitrospirae bacterium]|nr:hypothetical protein [Nitrospirota bacterium]
MPADVPIPDGLRRRACVCSALLPGLGQAVRGYRAHAASIFITTAGLLGCTALLARTGGGESAVFFLMLLILPWWAIQSYGASLPDPLGWKHTLQATWSNSHDIRYLGALFLLTAVTDLYIILARPDYALTVFCLKPDGLLGILAKAQSPTLHLLIGYGFLRLRRWGLMLYLAYAAFGVMNASANYACFGYGRIRTVFLLSLIVFTLYIVWRRRCFVPTPMKPVL